MPVRLAQSAGGAVKGPKGRQVCRKAYLLQEEPAGMSRVKVTAGMRCGDPSWLPKVRFRLVVYTIPNIQAIPSPGHSLVQRC